MYLAGRCVLAARQAPIAIPKEQRRKAETVSIELLGGRIAFWLCFTPSLHVRLAPVASASQMHRPILH